MAAEQELRVALGFALLEVMQMIRKPDTAGAEEYLLEVKRVAGQQAHDVLCDMIANATGSPKWVYFE